MAVFHSLSPRNPKGKAALLALLLIFGFLGWRYLPTASTHFFGNSIFGNSNDISKRPAKGPAPIPVTIQTVQNSDFPVYLNGLGTVEPYNTVTVRSRVDGQVIKIGFHQGQMVKEGDLLVQIDSRPFQAALEQAQSKKAQDDANLKNAQLDLKRYTTLAEQDFSSRQQLDTQQAKVDQLVAQIAGDQATIDNAQTQLSYTSIRAPLSGKTGFRLVDPGNIVHANDATGIVSIVKLQPISVVFTAPEEEIGEINKALSAGTVPVTALSSDGAKTLAQGQLALVNNQIDQTTGTIRMKATFQNKDNALWPGLSIAARLLVDTRKNVVVVPDEAIQHGPDGLYAFVVSDNNKVAMRNLKVSNEGTAQAVVDQGLTAGERLVVAGQYRLTVGALVAPRDQGAPPSAAAGKQVRNTSQKAP